MRSYSASVYGTAIIGSRYRSNFHCRGRFIMAQTHQSDAVSWPSFSEIDTTVPHVSRVLDYLLGGTANFESDRAVAEHAFARWPGEVGGVDGVRVDIGAARNALVRIVSHLAGEVGIRQFLDLCSGLPTENNVHEVAQRIAPDSRVVYVDHDPIIVAHSRHLLDGAGTSNTVYLHGAVENTETILRQASDTLDFSQPVA